MTWTYSGDPSKSVLDQYRFTIGDTTANDIILQDEEINFLITKYPIEDELLYNLFDATAQAFARKISRKLGPQSEDTKDRLAYYKEKAEFYRKRVTTTYGLSQPVSADAIFYKGMHDNVRYP